MLNKNKNLILSSSYWNVNLKNWARSEWTSRSRANCDGTRIAKMDRREHRVFRYPLKLENSKHCRSAK